MKIKIAGFFLVFGFWAAGCFAQDVAEIAPFTKEDRVLVLAPHPDDEAIGAAGVLQRAVKAGSRVKVVCFTNGDANEVSFIIYEKRFCFLKGEFLHMGEVRRKETLAAMEGLGIPEKDVAFLGYPDFGTLLILTRYWGHTKPYRSLLARVTKVSYKEAVSYGAPYVGESILKDLKSILLDFRPTKIFVSNPVDTNRDHRALYLFLQLALWDLEHQLQKPVVYPYLIHVVGWPKPRGFHADLALEPPLKYREAGWQKLTLTDEEIQAKYKAVQCYKSQNAYNASYLPAFVRKNELFGEYPDIVLRKKAEQIDWKDVEISKEESVQEAVAGDGEAQDIASDDISGLAYGCQDDHLWVRVTLKRKLDKRNGVFLYLLGYNPAKDFSGMPKLHISIGLFRTKVMDKMKVLSPKLIHIDYKDTVIIVKIPFSALGDPDRILAAVHASGFPFEATGWRILDLRE